MPGKDNHHCNAGGKKGCSGNVKSGENCSKCGGYSKCENADGKCGKFVNVAGKTCPTCIAKAAGDAKRAKEAEKEKTKQEQKLQSRDVDDPQLVAREPDPDFIGEPLVARGIDFEETGIFARGLDAYMVPHVHPPKHPLVLTSDGLPPMPHKAASGISGFFFGVAVTLSIVMVYGLWRRFRQKQQYSSVTRY